MGFVLPGELPFDISLLEVGNMTELPVKNHDERRQSQTRFRLPAPCFPCGHWLGSIGIHHQKPHIRHSTESTMELRRHDPRFNKKKSTTESAGYNSPSRILRRFKPRPKALLHWLWFLLQNQVLVLCSDFKSKRYHNLGRRVPLFEQTKKIQCLVFRWWQRGYIDASFRELLRFRMRSHPLRA